MLENLFLAAARDLRKNGWTQPRGDNALLFYHPEFGLHEFFKACHIQSNADQIRRRRRRVTVAVYVTLAALCVLAGAGLTIFTYGGLL